MTLFQFMSSPIWLYWIAPGTVILVAAIIGVNVVNRILSDRYDRHLQELRARARSLFSDMKGKSPEEVDIPEELLTNLEPLRIESLALEDKQLQSLRQLLIDKGLARRLVEQLQHSGKKWRQVGLLNDLAWLTAPEGETTASEYLESQDPEVAYTALAVLANIDTISAYSSLLGGLELDALSRSRVAAVAETAEPRAGVLIEKSYGPDPQLRYWCAYLMGRSRLEACRNRLMEMTTDEDAFVRTAAVKSLGWLQASPDSSQTIERLLDDPKWHVRAQAAKAVGYLNLESLAPKLIALLSDRNWWVREDAVDALEIVGRSVAPQLEANLRSDDRFVRNRSAELIGRLGLASKAIADLAGEERAANEAAELLVKLGKAEAIGVIETALETTHGTQQMRLIPVMRKIGDQRAAASLLELAETSKDKQIVAAAKDALETIAPLPEEEGEPPTKQRAA